MFPIKQKYLFVLAGAGFFAAILAFGQTASAPASATNATAPAASEAPKLVAGEVEAKKLLLLMDADKDGRVSKAEFMSFMEAEFDRLDKNKDGYLNVKELEQTQLMTVHRGGGHR